MKGSVGKSPNVVWYSSTINRDNRHDLLGHRSAVLWFTGLSGSGKSTLANAVSAQLYKQDCLSHVLDGDNVRHGLCRDLGFSLEDRTENIRRVSEVAKIMAESSAIVLTAFISPLRTERECAREIIGRDDFIEIYCRASLDVCEGRDVKGLYRRARKGEIPCFTGISSPYESPEMPDLIVDTGTKSLGQCVHQVVTHLSAKKVIPSPTNEMLITNMQQRSTCVFRTIEGKTA